MRRKTAKKRLSAKLQQVKQELRRRMHELVPLVGQWVRLVVRGYNQYHGVPGNWSGDSRNMGLLPHSPR